ncbi:unnamed protein product [Caenorhabditis brenneri]
MTDRFRVPKLNFFTPEDATTWAVILETRYLNDRMDDMVYLEKVSSHEKDSKTGIRSNEKCAPWNLREVKKENCFQQVPFSQVLYKRQKPNLFGNSVVSLKMLNDVSPQVRKEPTSSKKRPKLEQEQVEENSFSKRKK